MLEWPHARCWIFVFVFVILGGTGCSSDDDSVDDTGLVDVAEDGATSDTNRADTRDSSSDDTSDTPDTSDTADDGSNDTSDATTDDGATDTADEGDTEDADAAPPECTGEQRLCEGVCAACPTGDGIAQTTCDTDRCVVDNCAFGYEPCAQGCCTIGAVSVSQSVPARHPSIALDAQGRPHIAYQGGQNELEHAWWDGQTWQTEIVDGASTGSSGATGYWASLAIDAQDRLHIGYYNQTLRRPKYAHFDGTTWTVEDVRTSGSWGEYSSLALDSQGRPQMSYVKWYDNYIHLSRRGADGEWTHEKVTFSGWPHHDGMFTNLALDSLDQPHISSYGSGGQGIGPIEYVTRETGDPHWESNHPGSEGWHNAIDVDQQDRPHIAFNDRKSGVPRYTYFDGADWQKTRLGSCTNCGTDIALDLDDQGRPHILYYTDIQDLIYAHHDGSQWQYRTLAAGGENTRQTDIKVDASGRAHVVWIDFSSHSLMYQLVTP